MRDMTLAALLTVAIGSLGVYVFGPYIMGHVVAGATIPAAIALTAYRMGS